MATEMTLNFSRKDFEAIYFKDHQADYFRSPTVKGTFIAWVISACLALASGIYGAVSDNYGLLIITSIALVMTTLTYLRACRVLYKWKAEISAWLDREEQYNDYRIIVSENSFILRQDDKETMERWSNFSTATISDEYMLLAGSQNFIIPSSSLKPEDYAELRKVVSEKIS